LIAVGAMHRYWCRGGRDLQVGEIAPVLLKPSVFDLRPPHENVTAPPIFCSVISDNRPEGMTSTSLSIEQLPLEIITKILKWLPVGSLYVLERTSKRLRAAVLSNTFLKYQVPGFRKPGNQDNAFERKSFLNPLSHGIGHTIHHGWEHVQFPFENKVASQARALWRSRLDPMLHRSWLPPTNLAHQSVVYPPVQKMILHGNYGIFRNGVELEREDGGPVTFEDICRLLRKEALPWGQLQMRMTWYRDNVFYLSCEG